MHHECGANEIGHVFQQWSHGRCTSLENVGKISHCSRLKACLQLWNSFIWSCESSSTSFPHFYSTYNLPKILISCRTVAESKIGYSLLIDYVPREELLSSLEYYDKYFGVKQQLLSLSSWCSLSGQELSYQLNPFSVSPLASHYHQDVEASLSTLVAGGLSKNIMKRTISNSVLSKMLQSPFSLSADIDLEVHDTLISLNYNR
jgi:hypothetical protein